ncbi:MAG: pentapeptide repeat-containing protein [Hyphomonadaceae bacterium]
MQRRAIAVLRGFFGAALCAAALGAAALSPARAQSAAPISPAPPQSAVTCKDFDATRPLTPAQLESARLCQEISKLQQEVLSLRTANGAPWSAILTPWSSVFTGLAALIGAVVGFTLQQSLARSQSRRLDQERVLQRDQHNLKLIENLGAESRVVQLASVSALLRRIEDILDDPAARTSARAELKTLSDVAIAAMRDPGIDEAVVKFLADEVVKVFNLVRGDDAAPARLALSAFNLQGARLATAYWAKVDARDVDFFRADLQGASLRGADLRGAVLYETKLNRATLIDAKLSGANLQGADLSGARLAGADFSQARNLDQAVFDAATSWSDATRWPPGFTPPARG